MRLLRKSLFVAIALLSVGVTAGADDKKAEADPNVVDATWQHHSTQFDYFGVTTLFSCTALEGRVKAILLHFGARRDAKVFAYGCRGADLPTHHAVVESDFSTLAPAVGSGADEVPAHWAMREIRPERPSFMDEGDCELVRAMKQVILSNFALQEPQYNTDCVQNRLISTGYHVQTQVLMPVPHARSQADARH